MVGPPNMIFKFDYCRGMRKVSLRGLQSLVDNGRSAGCCRCACRLPSPRNIPARSRTPIKIPRRCAPSRVLEWTGDEQHPKTSRLVPICIYDGQELRMRASTSPSPIRWLSKARSSTSFLQDGKPVGFFDIESAGASRAPGSATASGKPLPKPKPAPVQAGQDRRRRCPKRRRPSCTASILQWDCRLGSGSGGSGSNAPPPDPDRPTLHKGPDASSDGTRAIQRHIPARTPVHRLPIPIVRHCTAAPTTSSSSSASSSGS